MQNEGRPGLGLERVLNARLQLALQLCNPGEQSRKKTVCLQNMGTSGGD